MIEIRDRLAHLALGKERALVVFHPGVDLGHDPLRDLLSQLGAQRELLGEVITVGDHEGHLPLHLVELADEVEELSKPLCQACQAPLDDG